MDFHSAFQYVLFLAVVTVLVKPLGVSLRSLLPTQLSCEGEGEVRQR
jgi:hypothetical protein